MGHGADPHDTKYRTLHGNCSPNAAEVDLCRHLQTESGAAGSWPQNSLLGAETGICLGVNRLCFGQILANPLFSYTNVKSNRK